jgi:oxygen-dependent protoporphyrinogen oxidase
MTRRIAVVGGGITGLAAAYELRVQAPDAEIVVFEATDRLGGKVATTTFAGRAIDEGADAFLARVPWGLELCRELGIDTQLVSPVQQ